MIITYNHAKYIARAIESVVSQEVDFPFAVHIIDDCSTDGAQDIIRDYAARYPGIVKPFINKKNIGHKVAQWNFHRGVLTLDGEYMAILEGDDCWTSNEKLRVQVEFLEGNPDFVACAHNALTVYEDGLKEPHHFGAVPTKDVHDIDDLIALQSFFHTSTLLYRNVFYGRVPRFYRSPLSCDIFITIAHAQFGKIKYLPFNWSIYRVHQGGMFSGMSKTKGWIWNIDGMRKCNRWLGYRYFPQLSKAIYLYSEHLLAEGREEDGLTPKVRRKYAALAKLYRWLHRTHHGLAVALDRVAPGRRKITKPLKLNLGCGRVKPPGYVNVDVAPEVDPDLVCDLERARWPWPNDVAEEVRFIYALEHMGADPDAFVGIMKELYRVCAPGALVVIRAAHPRHDAFADDPTKVRVISPTVMGAFDATLAQRSTGPSLARKAGVDFELVRREIVLDETYRAQLQNGQLSRPDAERLVKSGYNVARDFIIELRVHKPPRPAATT